MWYLWKATSQLSFISISNVIFCTIVINILVKMKLLLRLGPSPPLFTSSDLCWSTILIMHIVSIISCHACHLHYNKLGSSMCGSYPLLVSKPVIPDPAPWDLVWCIHFILWSYGPKGPVGVLNDPYQDDWRIVQPNLVRFFDHHSRVFGSLSWCISLLCTPSLFRLPMAIHPHISSFILHPLWYVQVRPKGGETNIQSIHQLPMAHLVPGMK